MDQTELAAHIIRPSCAHALTLELRIRKAFKAAQSIWFGSEELKFRAAVGAVVATTKDEKEKDRLIKTYQVLAVISSSMKAGVIHADDIARLAPDGFEPLPLVAMWREAKGQ